MTDEQIVEGLKCCNNGLCEICPYHEEEEFSADCRERNGIDALDLVTRQKTENERLKAMIEAAEDHYNPLPFKGIFDEKIEEARAEAIREFAERLKAEATLQHGGVTVVYGSCIDNLVKEMTEETS